MWIEREGRRMKLKCGRNGLEHGAAFEYKLCRYGYIKYIKYWIITMLAGAEWKAPIWWSVVYVDCADKEMWWCGNKKCVSDGHFAATSLHRKRKSTARAQTRSGYNVTRYRQPDARRVSCMCLNILWCMFVCVCVFISCQCLFLIFFLIRKNPQKIPLPETKWKENRGKFNVWANRARAQPHCSCREWNGY